MHVLIVDDEAMLREAYSRCLRLYGHTSVTAQDGQEALDMLRGGLRVDVIVSDNDMPNMTGEGLCTALRSDGSTVPFVLISGNSAVVGKAKSFGASKAFMKPVMNAELAEVVASFRVP